MSNFLKNPNVITAATAAAIGAIALSGCAEAKPDSDSVSCSGVQEVTVQPGDTLSSIINNDTADGALPPEKTHLVVRFIGGEWHKTGAKDWTATDFTVSNKDMTTFNTGFDTPNLSAGETVKIPETCIANVNSSK